MFQYRFECSDGNLGIIVKHKIWFWVGAALFYASGLVYLLVWPLILLYSSVLCVIGWLVLPGRGRDVVLVHNGTDGPDGWMPEIEFLVADRAMLLDYKDRKHWKRWSLPVQCYYHFGPLVIPQRFIPDSLPVVIVLHKFRWPKTFSFGRHSREPAEKMRLLRAQLTETRA